MRTRFTKVLTIAAASAALLGGAALATAGTASAAAPAHAVQPIAVRVAPHHRAPVRTERVWVDGRYETVRVHGRVKREWVPGHYVTVVVRGR
ncbi:hypothetical protein GXW83_32270 [Streptacidiphilus sp. PB12-B1b]|uniref:hypothetical protein n=1 Tax=Streptacidiphilus sp. PB12-B1b TaxID=2705012 RepID=UPI0015F8319A|nr:hypothetical protein [Streptacidiphilus sp. PB12-B1b]QMU79685.1 hypothetical protein GXW83_32270 [Streptacidiphilus sp. PB12-B1b]